MSPSLADRLVGSDGPIVVVAEIGSNHDGDLDRALALVDAAAGAGADVVQFHAFHAARLAATVAARAPGPRDAAETSAYLARVELRTEWHARLRDRASARRVAFVATPFDEERAALLAALGVAAFPVAAGDLGSTALLRALGGFGRPVLPAVGQGGRPDVEQALAAIGDGAGAASRRPAVVLLAGPGEDPAADADVRALDDLRVRFGCATGWRDARTSHALALGAIALGARVVTKPFTDDRRRRGPGHAAALEPADLRGLVSAVRELEGALREAGAGSSAPSVGSRAALR